MGRSRHSGFSIAVSRSQPAPFPSDRNRTASSHLSSASQYSRAAGMSSWNVVSSSLRRPSPSPPLLGLRYKTVHQHTLHESTNGLSFLYAKLNITGPAGQKSSMMVYMLATRVNLRCARWGTCDTKLRAKSSVVRHKVETVVMCDWSRSTNEH